MANKCVSNRIGTSSVVNGEYIDDGLNAGKESYKLTNTEGCSGTFYLYYHNEGNNIYRWWIGPIKDGTTYWARCSEQADTPEACNVWAFPSDNDITVDIIDNAVTATDGSCPVLTCDALKISGSSYPSCDGVFDLTSNDNVFHNSNKNRYWYWYGEFNQWFCAETINTDCKPTVSASGGNSLLANTLTLGSSTTMPSESGTTTTTATVECIDKSQPITTSTPSNTEVRIYTGIGICLWDVIIPGVSKILNGYYEEIDFDKNGKSYYQQTTECTDIPYLFLYYILPKSNTIFPPNSNTGWAGGWIITKTDPSINPDFTAPIYGWCPLNIESPIQCGSDWRFSDNSVEGYSNYGSIQTINGQCPTLNCAQLDVTSSISNNPCVGSYLPLGTENNVFKKNDNTNDNFYWLFNPNGYYWLCNKDSYTKTCTININGDYAPNGWLISYPSFTFQSQIRGGDITFICYDTIITDNPTQTPSNVPSGSPTAYTNGPTDSPSVKSQNREPTQSPSRNTPSPNDASGSIGTEFPTISPGQSVDQPAQGNFVNKWKQCSLLLILLIMLFF